MEKKKSWQNAVSEVTKIIFRFKTKMSSEAEQKLSIMQKEAVITVSWCS